MLSPMAPRALFVVALFLGCSSESKGTPTVTPAVVSCAAPAECYTSFVARVESCLGATLSGAMDIDNRSCGSVTTGVAFHSPAGGATQHFTVTANGRACLEWTREANSTDFIAVSEGQTVKRTGTQLTCPDGTNFAIDPAMATTCPEKLPGGRYESIGSVQFQLTGSEKPQFRCEFVDGTFGDGGTGG